MTAYGEPAQAKNGTLCPCFADGRSAYSLYNPERDAMQFANSEELRSAEFIVIGGLASGLHVAAVHQKNPKARIIVIENSSDSFETLRAQFDLSELISNPHISFSTTETIRKDITEAYIPAAHGNFAFKALRSWADFHEDMMPSILAEIQAAIRDTSADYSVQARFGKIWQRNILQNLSFLFEHPECCIFPSNLKLPASKKAAIIAAGPSLDNSLKILQNERSDFFIVCTDTALQSVIARGIHPDACVTIDGQHISHNHFMTDIKMPFLCIIDLCANPEAARTAAKSGCKLLFAKSAHPFCGFAEQIINSVLPANQTDTIQRNDFLFPLYSGSGTVTIAATDFAAKSGFSQIVFFGSDFCYHSGKPYAGGTYLDALYAEKSFRCEPLENRFASLMFRTPLMPYRSKKQTVYANSVLESYAKSLSQYIKNTRGILFYSAEQELLPAGKNLGLPVLCGNVPKNSKKNCTRFPAENKIQTDNFGCCCRINKKNTIRIFHDAMKKIIGELESANISDIRLPPAVQAILPLAAWMKTNQNTDKCSDDKKILFFETINLAKKMIANYTMQS
ncbi:MAG: DUF115 domain-containing protein [Bacteroides sp.]|nr:DUF115 domain-containing protein [Prevotella sp.]MCM1407283.1 DUF115 domain-containing protein [Treponema brennaborense]MCM1469771.1 DUF115 domain-containing protein [Bacteroides sp.]